MKQNMKQNNIAVGQCYEWMGHAYMVMSGPSHLYYKQTNWVVQNTLSKVEMVVSSEWLLKLRRPFNNF